MVVKIGGRLMCSWRAVDDEGEVQHVLVNRAENSHLVIAGAHQAWAAAALAA